MKIGFIGTGVMGSQMVINLLKNDYDVTVYNRTKAHAQSVLDLGAHWADNPLELTKHQDVVITIVSNPKDVEETYFGDQGIFKAAVSGQILIDMTTSSPAIAKRIYEYGQSRKIETLDAPVSGGDVGAKNATLTIMVGGNSDTFQAVMPIFNSLGSSVNLFGEAGMGQNAKMANQIMIAGTMTGMSEALNYAKEAGLNLDQIMETIDGGSAQNWSMENYGPRVLAGDYQPGFAAKYLLKDLKIALEMAQSMQIDLPATQKAADLYQNMVSNGLGDEGTQGLVNIYNNWKK